MVGRCGFGGCGGFRGVSGGFGARRRAGISVGEEVRTSAR